MKFLGRTSKCITDADGSNMEWNLMLTCTFPINGAHSSEGALLAVGAVVAAVDIVVVGGHAVGCSSIPHHLRPGTRSLPLDWRRRFLAQNGKHQPDKQFAHKIQSCHIISAQPSRRFQICFNCFKANVINIYKKIWLSAENNVKVDGRINEKKKFFVQTS